MVIFWLKCQLDFNGCAQPNLAESHISQLLSLKTRTYQLQILHWILSHALQQLTVMCAASAWIFRLLYSLARSSTVVFAKLCSLLSFLQHKYTFYDKIVTFGVCYQLWSFFWISRYVVLYENRYLQCTLVMYKWRYSRLNSENKMENWPWVWPNRGTLTSSVWFEEASKIVLSFMRGIY
jgi:hypothetical protein